MIGIRLEPLDTWFFRDGTPFAAGSTPQDDVASLFPPHPATVVGALRAALAINHGWSGRGRWPQDICLVLGDGPEDLGLLTFDAPFLLRDAQPLFRSPRHLLGTNDPEGWTPRMFLRPGPPVACDLGGSVRLPDISGEGSESVVFRVEELMAGDSQWLTPAGMTAVLRGELPSRSEVVPSRGLWSAEPRIGLQLERETKAAKEGMLYSTQHVRPGTGISLGARVAGLPQDWTLPFGQLVSLGGESRLAECREWAGDLALNAPLAEIRTDQRVALIALSPLDISEDVQLGRQRLEAMGDAQVVSACLERPQRIGGWNSLTGRPLPLRSMLPPGSVLFCEVGDAARFEETVLSGNGVARLGSGQPWGFGLAALGVWPEETEVIQ